MSTSTLSTGSELAPVRVQSLGADIVRAVNTHVTWASGCMPVFANDDFDTHLLFTYCHRVCDDDLRAAMELMLLLVDDREAVRVDARLEYSQSRRLSVRDLVRGRSFRGVCFAWSQPEGRPQGFKVGNSRLAPIFYAFYQSDRIGRLDCVHSSPSRSNYLRERIFWVPEDAARVTGIVCAPLDAYESRPSRLTYTFGLKEEGAEWRYVTRRVPFQPTLWVDLGELFQTRFKAATPYMYSVQGAKGKGWLMTETETDFNLHHL